MSASDEFDVAATFLRSIGITVVDCPGAEGFLVNVLIRGETLFVDTDDLYDDGLLTSNMLHEAGHIAIVPSLFRPMIDEDIDLLGPAYEEWFAEHPDWYSWPESPIGRGIMQSGENEAIAWSYAACIAAGLDPLRAFVPGWNEDNAPGTGEDLALGLSVGSHFGIAGLAAGGMCDKREFPKMKRWLQI